MIYANEKDLHDINHLLIFDDTTAIAVLKLPFKIDKCVDFEDWYYWASKYLNQWAEEHNKDEKKINAKIIKVYHDVYVY